MLVRRKEIYAPRAVSVDTTLTVLANTNGNYVSATDQTGVFYSDTGNIQNSDLYAEYSPDGVLWFQDQLRSRSVTAGENWYTYVLGGFYSRISALKAVAAENVLVGVYTEDQSNSFRESILLEESTVNVGLSPGTIMYAGAEECHNVTDIVVYIDDNGNSNALDIVIWIAPEYPGGTPTWHVYQPAATAHTAKDRRAAFVVRNTMGQMIKVLGVKTGGAEDVLITVMGRIPYYRHQLMR